MPIHQGTGYVRIVGCHLLPQVYHQVDKLKLFSSSRRASRALAMVRLPSNYPYQMYGAVAGGHQRWQAGVRPPTYNSLRVADHAAASVIRAAAGWHTLPSAQFFQPLDSGWSGLEPVVVVVLCQFLQTYHKRLRHANAMVRASTQHGLYGALQRFHPTMPCVQRGLLTIPIMTSLCFTCTFGGFTSPFPRSLRSTGSPMLCAKPLSPGKQRLSTHRWMRDIFLSRRLMRRGGPWLPGSGALNNGLLGMACPSRYDQNSQWSGLCP